MVWTSNSTTWDEPKLGARPKANGHEKPLGWLKRCLVQGTFGSLVSYDSGREAIVGNKMRFGHFEDKPQYFSNVWVRRVVFFFSGKSVDDWWFPFAIFRIWHMNKHKLQINTTDPWTTRLCLCLVQQILMRFWLMTQPISLNMMDMMNGFSSAKLCIEL